MSGISLSHKMLCPGTGYQTGLKRNAWTLPASHLRKLLNMEIGKEYTWELELYSFWFIKTKLSFSDKYKYINRSINCLELSRSASLLFLHSLLNLEPFPGIVILHLSNNLTINGFIENVTEFSLPNAQPSLYKHYTWVVGSGRQVWGDRRLKNNHWLV